MAAGNMPRMDNTVGIGGAGMYAAGRDIWCTYPSPVGSGRTEETGRGKGPDLPCLTCSVLRIDEFGLSTLSHIVSC